MPTKNTNKNTASNKNNININIDLDKSPKRKRPRKKPSPPPEAPAVLMMPPTSQAWGVSAYAPRPVTYAGSSVMIQPQNPINPPAYFDKILTNQEAAMNDLRDACKSELDDVRQLLLAQASHTGHIAGIEDILRKLAQRFESETSLPSNPASSAGSAIHGGTSSSSGSSGGGDGRDQIMHSATTYHDAGSVMSWAPAVSAHGTIPVAQTAQTGGHAVIPNPPSVPSAPTGASGVGGGVSSSLPTAMSPPPPSINSISSDSSSGSSSSSSSGGDGRVADEESRISQARSALSQALRNNNNNNNNNASGPPPNPVTP
jgi:hypothetical protein